jgi:hypothetical protein
MQIGFDNSGKVWLVGEALPKSWNGMSLTVSVLTKEQEEAWSQLPSERSGTVFNGKVFSPVLKIESTSQTQKRLEGAVQNYLDAKAKSLGYDDIRSAISYRGDKNPQWSAEADALFSWRSDVWTSCIAKQVDVLAGRAPIPTIDDLIASLPVLVLP